MLQSIQVSLKNYSQNLVFLLLLNKSNLSLKIYTFMLGSGLMLSVLAANQLLRLYGESNSWLRESCLSSQALSLSPCFFSPVLSDQLQHSPSLLSRMSHSPEMKDDPMECPLCMEPLEIDDVNFFPCTCGYQICRFCWHRIRTDENGLCPACRKVRS